MRNSNQADKFCGIMRVALENKNMSSPSFLSAPYIIYVKDTLTLAGTISFDGPNGSNAVGDTPGDEGRGTDFCFGTVYGSGSGGTGGPNNGTSPNQWIGGGLGGVGGLAGDGEAGGISDAILFKLNKLFTGFIFPAGGGAGGGGGGTGQGLGNAHAGAGGGGGASGGTIVICARNIVITATGVIQALGGNGGNGGDFVAGDPGDEAPGGGGGGGGGGGLIYLVYETLSNLGTLDVSPGTGGLGGSGSGGVGGDDGLPGADGSAGHIYLVSLTDGVITYT